MSGGPGAYGRDFHEDRCQVCDGLMYVDGVPTIHDTCHRIELERAYPHLCPECRGEGKIGVRFESKEECCHGGPPMYGGHGGFAGCEYCPNLKRTQVPTQTKQCELCEGRGRLKTPPVPVMSQTGWRRG